MGLLSVKMNSEMELANKCLEICQTLENQGRTFSLSLTMGSGFTLNWNTKQKDNLLETRRDTTTTTKAVMKKKLTPSQQRRNQRRKEEFLRRKSEKSSESDGKPAEETPQLFKCDHCDKTFSTGNGMKIHIGKAHKKQETLRGSSSHEAALSVSPLKDIRSEPGDTSEVSSPDRQKPRVFRPDKDCPHGGICKECEKSCNICGDDCTMCPRCTVQPSWSGAVWHCLQCCNA